MTENMHVHRLLDEAFRGHDMTLDAQDLKEEVRANLMARATELEASGRTPTDAAREAIAELGDVRELLGEGADASASASAPVHGGTPADGYAALMQRHQVRPKPAFVVRVVIWSLLAVAGIALGVVSAVGVLPIAPGGQIALVVLAAAALGLLVGDSLTQETTTNHPMPSRRAGGYGLATLLGAAGLGLGGLVAAGA
uniref:permease prefix domain 1-containing protein n=1 Tax=Microbacterium sp. CPCC 204701 TaxID=2493084 RepID=UPI00197C879B